MRSRSRNHRKGAQFHGTRQLSLLDEEAIVGECDHDQVPLLTPLSLQARFIAWDPNPVSILLPWPVSWPLKKVTILIMQPIYSVAYLYSRSPSTARQSLKSLRSQPFLTHDRFRALQTPKHSLGSRRRARTPPSCPSLTTCLDPIFVPSSPPPLNSHLCSLLGQVLMSFQPHQLLKEHFLSDTAD